MLKSGLSLWCYQLGTSALAQVGPIDYGRQVERLSFTTTAPGGYGTLEAVLKIPNARLPRPEFSLMAHVALMGHGENGVRPLFLGEQMQPEIGYSQQDGEYIKISALGVGNALRDDPLTKSYTTQTVQQIAQDQLSIRSGYNMPIANDNALLFPDNPAGTYSTGYVNRTMEEVLADISALAGDYQWGTWAHPSQTDAAGFPLGQVSLKLRDPNTLHYTASINARDVISFRIMPTSDRAYNVVSLDAYDFTQNPPVVTKVYTDPRLTGGGGQGTAPFRRRKYARDLSGSTTVNGTQANAIAAVYGAQMQNITTKEEIILKAARNAQGGEIPLWSIQADHNIAVPEMAVRGTQLSTSFTPGVNQYYILSTRYEESSGGEPQLTLECDNYFDRAAVSVARLLLWSDREARDNRTSGQVQKAGANIYGGCGTQWPNATAAHVCKLWVQFPAICATVPSSITLTADIGTLNVSGSASAAHIAVNGFQLNVTANANGDVEWFGHYQTVGL